MVNTAVLKKIKGITKEAADILAYCECIGSDDCDVAITRIFNRPTRSLTKVIHPFDLRPFLPYYHASPNGNK
jgi:hypothetical protein